MSLQNKISWKAFNDALNAHHFADRDSPILSSCDQDDVEETRYSWEDGQGNTFETVLSLNKTTSRFSPDEDTTEDSEIIPVDENGNVTVFDENDTKVEITFYKAFNPFI